MKHQKMFGLLALAAASLMAFASSASATPTLTSPAGTEYTGALEATMTPGTSSVMKAGIETTCTGSTATGTVTTNTEVRAGGAGSITTEKCSKDMVTLKGGELTIFPSGTVFAIGNEVTVNDTSLGISCVYGGGASPGTDIGTLIGGSPAKISINTTKLKKISGSFFCASEGTWTSNYTVTKPSSLFLG
ncbi:MAG: hypothetical protein ACTHNY_02580 [Solirubrobacterales bacterium]